MKILSIDGGGIRGIIPATVLAELERRAGRRVHELFDFIAGTSTGGILTCALARPQPQSAQELIGLYEHEGPQIFHRSLLKKLTSVDGWVDERYDDDGLNAALKRHLGDARLKEALVPIMVTAYDLERRAAWFFRSERAKVQADHDFALWEVARATSAAPTYFEPHNGLVDGGVFAVNPALCAYVDVPHVDLLVSLGTGSHTSPISGSDARGWGQLEWARPIIDIVFDGIADTVEFELSRLLAADEYYRFQLELRHASTDLDDASEDNLRKLRAEADALIAARSDDLDRLVARLSAP